MNRFSVSGVRMQDVDRVLDEAKRFDSSSGKGDLHERERRVAGRHPRLLISTDRNTETKLIALF